MNHEKIENISSLQLLKKWIKNITLNLDSKKISFRPTSISIKRCQDNYLIYPLSDFEKREIYSFLFTNYK